MLEQEGSLKYLQECLVILKMKSQFLKRSSNLVRYWLVTIMEIWK